MTARNPKTAVKVVPIYFPTATTATATLNNTAPNLDVECKGFTHALIFAVIGAAVTLVTDTITVQIKETDTAGSAYSDVSGALFSALTGTGDNTVRLGEINLQGRKKFLSATLTEAGTFDGIVGVFAVLMNPEDTALTAQSYDFSV
jgi:hypothetical protein